MLKRYYFAMGGIQKRYPSSQTLYIYKGEGLDPGAESPLIKLVE